jgi:hypothetical protein
MTVFVIDTTAEAALASLKTRAEDRPISLTDMRRMVAAAERGQPFSVIPEDQTIYLPMGWSVTFTHEDHPGGRARHMSMASPNRSRIPIEPALEMVMGHLGFTVPLGECTTWLEPLAEGHAVNVVEILATDS